MHDLGDLPSLRAIHDSGESPSLGLRPPLLLRVYKPHMNGLRDLPAHVPYTTQESHHHWAYAPFIATGLKPHVNGLRGLTAHVPYMTQESHHHRVCVPFIATGLQPT